MQSITNSTVNKQTPGKRMSDMGANWEATPVVIPVTYRSEWQDGFGVRGWKLDSALDDPNVIAATAETGCKINTSVLVHDMLDHAVSGFPLSGHRHEAMALIQLASRTDSDPQPDYAQMVDEDLMRGTVSCESMRSFLPQQLVRLLPKDPMSGGEIIAYLSEKKGSVTLRSMLIDHFIELGRQGNPLAMANWHNQGLDYAQRKEIGWCLQKLLVWVDGIVVENAYIHADAEFRTGNLCCEVCVTKPAKHIHHLYVTSDQ